MIMKKSEKKNSNDSITLTPVEQEVFQENLKEAIVDAKKPNPDAKNLGIAGIIVGIIGLFVVPPINIVTGVAVAILGIYANHHKHRTLGAICGILAILNLLTFFLFGLGKFPFLA
jgi:hypothetical protein